MSTPRWQFTATGLTDRRVLVVGGLGTPDEDGPGLASAELYDPSTGKWTSTGSLHSPRARHTATLLRDGRVLVAGGICPGHSKLCPPLFSPDLDPSGAVATAELWDPHTGKWSLTESMTTPRAWHPAILLDNGIVLVAGAEHADESFGWPEPFAPGILAATELYNPATGKWTATGRMTTARTGPMAVLLPNGHVLVAGGLGPVTPTSRGALSGAEVYDPTTGMWSATGSLTAARDVGPAMVLLDDGRVLMTGGGATPEGPPWASTEIYDPRSGAWTASGDLITGREATNFAVLTDGKVFIVGGYDLKQGLLSWAELYDPSIGTWRSGGNMAMPRFGHAVALLVDGRVLVVGGNTGDEGHGLTSSAELYDEGSRS